MDVLFLDIDGVLCHCKTRAKEYIDKQLGKSDRVSFRKLDAQNLAMLHDLQKKLGFKIVISSDAWKAKNKEEMEKVFIDNGYPLDLHEDWCTPDKVHYTTAELHEKFKDIDVSVLYNMVKSVIKRYPTQYGHIKPDCKMSIINLIRNSLLNYRGMKIDAWLNRQPNKDKITYLIVDDSNDIFPLPEESFLHVKDGERRGGLSIDEFEMIEKYFNYYSR